jgi:hypothetical protein
MFTDHSLSDPVAAVHEEHAPDALVLDVERDFETLPAAQAEELGLLVDSLDPFSCPDGWLPPDAPAVLDRYAGSEFTIGMPGDGSVAWTRQTDPPVVLCKNRLGETPDTFADFLLAEALVQVGTGDPEQFIGFFGDRYPAFAAALADVLDPVETYQVAAACYDAYLGLETRDTFATWDGPLFDAWLDAGERLEGRLADLPGALARGQTSVGDAAELACSAVKHAGDLPAPFDALDAELYREHGAAYAVEWADRTAETLD